MLIRFSFIFLVFFLSMHETNAGTFTVDYENRQFLKDDKPFRYISGSIHYMRVHPNQWNDRLQRIRALGLNVVQTYVPWNLHEPEEGVFDFSGAQNLSNFLTLAQNNGLYVLLRPGPYICAEWENGGFPYWLLKYDNIKLRTYDPIYINAVQNYYNQLLPIVQPHLYVNGGNILMIQVENEYGYAGPCSHNYTSFVRDLIRAKLGQDVALYTTDGASNKTLECGSVPDTLTTVDFGMSDDKSIDDHFTVQALYNNGGPYVCSEYWVDWYTTWGDNKKRIPNAGDVVNNMNHMYTNWNASFNTYMIYGGTNFGFTNGADGGGPPIVTSYDYGAAIAENGDITPTYTAVHSFIGNLTGWEQPPLPIPSNNPATAYGQIALKRIGTNLISTLTQIQEPCQQSQDPMVFEKMGYGYGYVLYSATLTTTGTTLSAPNIKDYGYVFVNNVYQGMLNRDSQKNLTLNANSGDMLRILVENRGREKIGVAVFDRPDRKGLHENVTLNGALLQNWFQCGINMTVASINSLTSNSFLMKNHEFVPEKAASTPGVYAGTFTASQLTDTFFDSTGWGKGQLFVNGFNVGRYWPSVGPQITLYVPKPVIQPTNTVVIIELIGSTVSTANFVDHAIYSYH